MKAWENGSNFKDALLADPELSEILTRDEIESAFDMDHALRWWTRHLIVYLIHKISKES